MRNPKACIPDFASIATPGGSRLKNVYHSVFDGKKIVLECSGVMDIQEQIESFAPFTDLNYMLHRLSVGDTSVLAKRTPMYGDFSRLPDNPVDAINLVHSAERKFIALPVDEKEKYNNDYRVWLSAIFDSSNNNGSAVRSVADPAGDPDVKEKN